MITLADLTEHLLMPGDVYQRIGAAFQIDDDSLLMLSTSLFISSGAILGGVGPERREAGLYRLVNDLELPTAIYSNSNNVERKIGCVKAMERLFADLFSRGDIPQICYMWWDCFRWFSVPPPSPIRETLSEVLISILKSESVECQRSALHGMSHLMPTADRKAEIEAFIMTRNPRGELLELATAAIAGDLL